MDTAPKTSWAFGTNNVVVVEYTEPTTGGDSAGTYTITGSDSSTIAVTAAAYLPAGATGNVAVLTLAAAPTFGLSYTVKATAVLDVFGNSGTDTKPIALYTSGLLLDDCGVPVLYQKFLAHLFIGFTHTCAHQRKVVALARIKQVVEIDSLMRTMEITNPEM